MPFDFAALEAARKARDPRDLTAPVKLPPSTRQISAHRLHMRNDYAVGREYEDGRFVPTHLNLTREVAEAKAGRMRDTSSDDQVKAQLDECWQWSYRAQKGNRASNAKASDAKTHGGGFGFMTPARRAEISRKANAARWGNR